MIHKFQQNGYFIVLDVNTGAIHLVDELVYEILEYNKPAQLTDGQLEDLREKYGRDAVADALDETKELIEQGLLYSEPAVYEADGEAYYMKALCLLVAQECNMRCAYCFAQEGEYHSRQEQHGPSLMNTETAHTAIDFLIKSSGERHNLEVDFFGGEPLLNFDVIKQTIAYARVQEKEHGKNIRFTLTTNGLLLDDEKAAFINEHMHNLVLSHDGRKEINDKHRGSGSYDKLTDKFINLANARDQDNYYIRGTFTAKNLDFAEDVLHLADLGFKQISIEPVINQNGELALDFSHIPELMASYDTLAKEMLVREQNGAGFNFFHFMMDLENGQCFSKKITGCGAGYEYLSVTADGRLFPCHQFTGIEKFALGDVFTGIKNPGISERLSACNVINNEICQDCWAKYHCSGGCVANAYNENGNLDKPDEIGCTLMKKRIECALMIAAARASGGA